MKKITKYAKFYYSKDDEDLINELENYLNMNAEVVYNFFDLDYLFNIWKINYIYYLIGSIIIIYNSIRIYMRKNLLFTIYSFSLILLGYIIILFGINNEYKLYSIVSFFLNHILINFIFYIIVALFIFLYSKSDTPIIYSFINYRYMIYIIILSKLFFPFGFGFLSNWYYILSIINEKKYFLFIPFIFEKISISFLLIRYYMTFTKSLKEYHNFDIKEIISLKTNYMISILTIFIIIMIFSLFEGYFDKNFLKYIKII